MKRKLQDANVDEPRTAKRANTGTNLHDEDMVIAIPVHESTTQGASVDMVAPHNPSSSSSSSSPSSLPSTSTMSFGDSDLNALTVDLLGDLFNLNCNMGSTEESTSPQVIDDDFGTDTGSPPRNVGVDVPTEIPLLECGDSTKSAGGQKGDDVTISGNVIDLIDCEITPCSKKSGKQSTNSAKKSGNRSAEKDLDINGKSTEVGEGSTTKPLASHGIRSCTIVFGAEACGMSKPAGAGALLLADDGSQYYGFCEGLGYQRDEVAEYRALILGMKQAVMKGFKHVTVKGDSEYVINQFGEPWQTIDMRLMNLCLEAMQLRNNFDSFSIQHIPKEHNKAAHLYASQAVKLEEGQVQEELVTE